MIFLMYLFCCLGVSYAWSDTEVSVPIRNFIANIPYVRKPLLCQECSSFWISLLISFFINPFSDVLSFPFSNIFSAFCGFFINLYFVRKHIIPFKE